MKLLLLALMTALSTVASAQSGALAGAKARAQQQIYGNNPEVCAMFFASGDPKAAGKAYSLGCSRPASAPQHTAPQPKATQVQCVSKDDPDYKLTALWSGDRLVVTRRSNNAAYISSAIKDPSMGGHYKIVASASNGEPVTPPLEHIHMHLSSMTGNPTGTLTRLWAWNESIKGYLSKDQHQFSCETPTRTNAIPAVAVVAPPPATKGSSYDEFCAAKPEICRGHLADAVKYGEGQAGSDCINRKGASLKTIYTAVNEWSIKNPQQTATLFVGRPDPELRVNHTLFVSEALSALYPCQR